MEIGLEGLISGTVSPVKRVHCAYTRFAYYRNILLVTQPKPCSILSRSLNITISTLGRDAWMLSLEL